MNGTRYLHICESGHYWIEQPDGGVSPSWGAGGTSVSWPGYDKRTCPEPRRRNRQCRCPSCGERFYVGGCSRGHEPPPPVCRKPPVQTFIWVDGNYRRKQAGGWLEITPEQLRLGEEPAERAPGNAVFRGRR